MDATSKKKLKAQAHTLKPVVIIGQAGLTEAVLAEIDIALNSHELIKVKIRAEKDARQTISDQICTKSGADLVQMIGQIAVLYRLTPKEKDIVKTKRYKPKSAKARSSTNPYSKQKKFIVHRS